jgi:predicted polyphosphate/ATP-dependent NAD kinase
VATVGVVANPASGRDIRRLVTGASVFDNAEKGSMVFRLLTGLGAVGVEKVWMMPAGEGLSGSLERRRNSAARGHGPTSLPALEFLDMRLRGDARDSTAATRLLRDHGVGAIVVLGGDGTCRVVAGACGDVPICALSTGTNNAFPVLLEATVAGMATGLVATGRVAGPPVVRRHKRFDVTVDGRVDTALVDVVATTDRFIGARALWRVTELGEAFVTFASPAAVGLAGVAGQVQAVGRHDDHALRLRLGPPERADLVVTAALAPGLVTRIGVSGMRRVATGEPVELEPADGALALDGEREIERSDSDRVTVELARGPQVIDVRAALAHPVARDVLGGAPTEQGGGN